MKHKTKIILGLTGLSIFFISRFVLANTLINQTIHDMGAHASIQFSINNYRSGQTFLASSAFTVSDIRYWIKSSNANVQSATFNLALYDLGLTSNPLTSPTLVASSTNTAVNESGSTGSEYTFTFSPAFTLAANHYYFVAQGSYGIGISAGALTTAGSASDVITGRNYKNV